MNKKKLKRLQKLAVEAVKSAERFSRTPEGRALEERLDFAALVLRRLRKSDITQKEFAGRIGMKVSRLNRILRGDEDTDISTKCKILGGL